MRKHYGSLLECMLRMERIAANDMLGNLFSSIWVFFLTLKLTRRSVELSQKRHYESLSIDVSRLDISAQSKRIFEAKKRN